MKKSYLLLLNLLFASAVLAQQLSIYTQISDANYAVNPAFTGIEKGSILSLVHRNQWLGIKDAPISQYINFSTRLGLSSLDSVKPNALFLSNNHIYRAQTQAVKTKKALPHSIGLQAHTDEAGAFQHIDAKLNYAYRTIIKKDYNLSLGLGAGISHSDILMNKLWVLQDGDKIYNEYRQENTNATYFSGNIGAVFYNKKLYIAFASNKLFTNQTSLTALNVGRYTSRIHHSFSGSYIIQKSRNLQIAPTLQVNKVFGAPFSIGTGLKIRHKNQIWAGANFRFAQGLSINGGLLVLNKIALNYAYEVSFGPIIKYQIGIHEIGLHYLINNKEPLKHLW